MPIVSSASLAVCRDETFIKTFVATKTILVATKKCLCRYIVLSRQNTVVVFVATKHVFFVSTKHFFFSFYRDKHRFDATNKCLSRQNVLSWQKSYLWQLRPMIIVTLPWREKYHGYYDCTVSFPKERNNFWQSENDGSPKGWSIKKACAERKQNMTTKQFFFFFFFLVLFPRRPSSPLTSSDTRLHPHFQQIPRRWHGQPNCKISRFTKHIKNAQNGRINSYTYSDRPLVILLRYCSTSETNHTHTQKHTHLQRWGATETEIKILSTEDPDSFFNPSLSTGVGQNIALHASRTAHPHRHRQATHAFFTDHNSGLLKTNFADHRVTPLVVKTSGW